MKFQLCGIDSKIKEEIKGFYSFEQPSYPDLWASCFQNYVQNGQKEHLSKLTELELLAKNYNPKVILVMKEPDNENEAQIQNLLQMFLAKVNIIPFIVKQKEDLKELDLP